MPNPSGGAAMKLLAFLLRSNSRKMIAVTCLGLASGLASAAVIAVVNSSLHSTWTNVGMSWKIPLAFALLVLLKVGASLASSLLLGFASQESILNLCTRLARRIGATPFLELEQIGPHRILTCLTEDVAVLSAAIQAVPTLLVNVAVLAGCAAYLAWISWFAAVLLVGIVVAASFCYKLLLARAYGAIQRARDGRDTLFEHFRALADGMKELKLNRARREMFFRENIDAAADHLRRENIVAMNRYATADGWSQTVFYLLLAMLLFVFPTLQHIKQEALTAYVFAALYMMAPVWGIIGALPIFNRGQASLAKLEELGLALTDTVAEPEAEALGQSSLCRRNVSPRPPIVEFRDVMFMYPEKDNGGGFCLGPINLILDPGELTLIIGGNGSGKSTLVKLLTGLYMPDSGEILVDGNRLNAETSEQYRQLFSAVYSDFYLFNRLVASPELDVKVSANRYLKTLDLTHKVQIEGNYLSTTALSQGQRRRLALLAAYLEDRPIYVLDEWAADQDPIFRQVFYLELLPELKRRGKTVVVITHDDRYFHLGDQVVKLDFGKVAAKMQPVTHV